MAIISEKSEKKGEFTGWAEDSMPEAPPAYAPPPGHPSQPSNPSNQPDGYPDEKGQSSSLADPYYSPPPHSPYASGSSPYPPGPDYAGPSQPQSPPQGFYPSPSGFSQGDSPNPDDANGGQQFPGFTYAGKAPAKRDPLNPPPASFTRQPNPQCTYPRLHEPVRIPAQDKKTLDKGFIPIFPAPQLLMAHDVQPADISRLLEDCHLMSVPSLGQKISANVAPLAMGIGFLPGLRITRALAGLMKRGNVDDVAGLLEVWDEAFFGPRKLRLSMQCGRNNDDSSSSSSSSSDSDSDHSHHKHRKSRSGADAYDGRGQTGYGGLGGRMVAGGSGLGMRAGLGRGFGGGLGGGRAGPVGGLGGGLGVIAGAVGSRMSMREERRAEKRAYRDDRRAAKRADRAQRRAERRARKAARRAAWQSDGVNGNGDERIYLVISNR